MLSCLAMCATRFPFLNISTALSAFMRAEGFRPLYFPSAFAFALPLKHHFTLELRHCGEHVQHQAACCSSRVHRVASEVQDPQCDTFFFELIDYLRQMTC
jgi:hypothetical protein